MHELRNLVIMLVIYGGLHLLYYRMRVSGAERKYIPSFQEEPKRQFWFGKQTPDNVARCLLFGLPINTSRATSAGSWSHWISGWVITSTATVRTGRHRARSELPTIDYLTAQYAWFQFYLRVLVVGRWSISDPGMASGCNTAFTSVVLIALFGTAEFDRSKCGHGCRSWQGKSSGNLVLATASTGGSFNPTYSLISRRTLKGGSQRNAARS